MEFNKNSNEHSNHKVKWANVDKHDVCRLCIYACASCREYHSKQTHIEESIDCM